MQHAVEALAKGKISDPDSNLIVTDGLLRRVIEDEVAQVGVSIQTTQICCKETHALKLKSGLIADPAWDVDDVTMFSRPICEVNVKEKPWEVASVEKKRKTA
jgi:hypothetical protein